MPHEKFGTRLSDPAFKRNQLTQIEREELMDSFAGRGLITDVVGTIDDGKEATVYLCAADPSTGVEWLAAKVYRANKFRAFRDPGRYSAGRIHMKPREMRAIENGSRLGRRLTHHEWVAWEWEVLCRLSDAGVDVPEPLASSADAILMEYVGDVSGGAPQLRQARLAPEQVQPTLRRLLDNVERLLDQHLVHGDLSAYNVLWWEERPWIIDVPQSLDARMNPDAQRLFERDVANVERYFRRYGASAPGFASRTWQRYRRGDLGR